MARTKKRSDAEPAQAALFAEAEPAEGDLKPVATEPVEIAIEPAEPETEGGDDEELVLDEFLVCALTGTQRKVTPVEQTLQAFIEQLHREYDIPLEDMERDVRLPCTSEEDGKVRNRTRTLSLAVFEHGEPHRAGKEVNVDAITRIAMVAKPGTKASEKVMGVFEEALGSLSQKQDQVFGIWTNGDELTFWMRTYDSRTGEPKITPLADIPAPDETLKDLESAERRPLRVATSDSLLRTFKRCHDYLYGNQNRRDAFWQLLYLIFAKILDEHSTSSRQFFVGATERNTEAGEKRIADRIKALFNRAKKEYHDVFRGDEQIELRDRALARVASELARYSFLSTDTDAKGMAYEAITSTTMKRERGQFFTPRNVIRMMVDMVNPQEGRKLLDPACGSGGFLVAALAHARRRHLEEDNCPHPEQPLPRELKRVAPNAKTYARESLWGLDVDPDLRKAARMNMVMNNDGHGNIYEANSLELVAALSPKATPRGREFLTDQMREFVKRSGGLKSFDYVCTNPPFGAKIPVDDPNILKAFDLGQNAKKLPPEILFIEACYHFLKPGTGVMAIVLPNGILGNPGGYMDSVRQWMLRHMELLASVDLPAEAFLPQVSVQASCVFLRRRDETEFQMMSKKGLKQGPVFMAIAEKCGHGRRGPEPTWVRSPDGAELIETKEVIERWERHGEAHERTRRMQVKRLADDLPWVAEEYLKARAAGRLA